MSRLVRLVALAVFAVATGLPGHRRGRSREGPPVRTTCVRGDTSSSRRCWVASGARTPISRPMRPSGATCSSRATGTASTSATSSPRTTRGKSREGSVTATRATYRLSRHCCSLLEHARRDAGCLRPRSDLRRTRRGAGLRGTPRIRHLPPPESGPGGGDSARVRLAHGFGGRTEGTTGCSSTAASPPTRRRTRTRLPPAIGSTSWRFRWTIRGALSSYGPSPPTTPAMTSA
jgi:hypothetical protein